MIRIERHDTNASCGSLMAALKKGIQLASVKINGDASGLFWLAESSEIILVILKHDERPLALAVTAQDLIQQMLERAQFYAQSLPA